jgi:alpha-tubulin suppressor-like RCC1 family protein
MRIVRPIVSFVAATTLVLAGAALTAAPAMAVLAPVTNVHITAKTADSVTLTWTAPADPSNVVDYQVDYLPAQLSWLTFVHAPSVDTSMTVTGLSFHTSYQFRVSPVYGGNPNVVGPRTLATSPVTFTDGGRFNSCSLLPDGSVECWGANANGVIYGTAGFLGDGSQTNSLQPVGVLLPEKATALSVGAVASCVIGETGRVFCWGRDIGTQGGSGTPDQNTSTPVLQPGIAGAAKVAVSTSWVYNEVANACVIDSGDQAWCWGVGNKGQLGNGTLLSPTLVGFYSNTATPLAVSAPPGVGFTDMSLSGSHSCFIGTDTHLYCTGDNTYGQLGIGSTDGLVRVPTLVPGLSNVTNVYAGLTYTCAVANQGNVYCWGDNSFAQLGTGDKNPYSLPQQINTDWTATSVSGWRMGACALGSDGTVKCWGQNWPINGTGGNALTPTNTLPTRTYSSIAGGGDHMCATTTDGTPYCWGSNDNNQLGSTLATNETEIDAPVDMYIATQNTPPPAIGSVSPLNGAVGSTITVTGAYLTAVSRIEFGGTPVAYSRAGNALVFDVPTWAAVGSMNSVSVVSFGGRDTYATSFLVTTSPQSTVNVSVTNSLGQPVTGGYYTWISQGRFSPPVPLDGNSSGTVTLPNVVSGPGQVILYDGQMPDGTPVSGSWNVKFSSADLSLFADPPAPPATLTQHVVVQFPDGSAVPGATVDGVGLSDSFTDTTVSHSLTYTLQNAAIQSTTDDSGTATLFGYKAAATVYATGSYIDSVLNQTSLPVAFDPQGHAITTQLDYLPVLSTGDGTISSDVGDTAAATFTVVDQGKPVAGQTVTLVDNSLKPSVRGLVSPRVTCPASFKGTTDSAGHVTIRLCTLVAGSHTYAIHSDGAVLKNKSISLSVAQVLATPDAPTTVVAVAGNRAATVSWHAPASDGGTPIVKYVVHATSSAASCTYNVSQVKPVLRCTVTGLKVGTSYRFTVVATNQVGDSIASGASAAVQPFGTPTTVRGLTVNAGASSVTVRWLAPATTNGAAVTGYQVQYRISGQSAWTTKTVKGQSCTLTKLHRKTTYLVRIAAVNKGGAGVWLQRTIRTG